MESCLKKTRKYSNNFDSEWKRDRKSESGITFSSIINDSLYDVMTYSKTKAL